MSDITAVPLRPIKKGSVLKLWIGIAALAGAAGVAAFAGTAKPVATTGTPEAYLAWNGKRPGVITTTSGLQYQVIKQGDGAGHPTATDVVLVAYEGRLRDGTVFDKNDKAPLEVNAVIAGWTEGLQLMSKGAKYRFWLKPELAYGPQASGPIPANSDLEFDVELIDYIPAAVLRQQQMMQGMPAGGDQAPVGQ